MQKRHHKITTGLFGENIAVEYLKKKGYNVIKRNFRQGKAEIDIIARRKKTAVFVEVKTRSGESWDKDLEAWRGKQKMTFLHAVKAYLVENKLWGKVDVRLDLICVDLESGNLTHIENALSDWA
ncbi:YraN family protein [candidate division WOR-3 bacterium]|nr:YraN family protein [candidate division WOR-3 bacterium]